MKMALIRLTPERLREQSNIYGNSSDEIQAILSKLRSMQTEIGDNWDGQAWDAFENQFNDLVPKVEAFYNLLDDIDAQLKEVARVVEETDQEISQKLGFK